MALGLQREDVLHLQRQVAAGTGDAEAELAAGAGAGHDLDVGVGRGGAVGQHDVAVALLEGDALIAQDPVRARVSEVLDGRRRSGGGLGRLCGSGWSGDGDAVASVLPAARAEVVAATAAAPARQTARRAR